MIDPQPDFQPAIGVPEHLAQGLRRIVAPNASPMTYRGTNTYVIGTTDLAVIDPGPLDDIHLDAILTAVQPDQHISHILVTHAHLDHSPLAKPLSKATGAPIHAFGDAVSGRRPIMQQLADQGDVGGGEGVDMDFVPDVPLSHGQSISGSDWTLRALHTPGHMANHLSFAWNSALFSGDLVMGWATSLVSPPDGDLTAFLQSLRDLGTQDWSLFYPGHGAPVEAPNARMNMLSAHRKGRETAILAALSLAPSTAHDLTQKIYVDIPANLLPAAERNVLAHLIDLTEKSVVFPHDGIRMDATFALSKVQA